MSGKLEGRGLPDSLFEIHTLQMKKKKITVRFCVHNKYQELVVAVIRIRLSSSNCFHYFIHFFIGTRLFDSSKLCLELEIGWEGSQTKGYF